LDRCYTRIEAGKSLDINSTILGRRVKEHQRYDEGQTFRGNGKLAPEQAEIRQLKAENWCLKMEKNILKKPQSCGLIYSYRKEPKIRGLMPSVI
jgi:transposase